MGYLASKFISQPTKTNVSLHRFVYVHGKYIANYFSYINAQGFRVWQSAALNVTLINAV